jgi:hypothetical protein
MICKLFAFGHTWTFYSARSGGDMITTVIVAFMVLTKSYLFERNCKFL